MPTANNYKGYTGRPKQAAPAKIPDHLAELPVFDDADEEVIERELQEAARQNREPDDNAIKVQSEGALQVLPDQCCAVLYLSWGDITRDQLQDCLRIMKPGAYLRFKDPKTISETPRRRNGTGTISFIRHTGRWRAVMPKRNRGRLHLGTYPTREEAQQALRTAILEARKVKNND